MNFPEEDHDTQLKGQCAANERERLEETEQDRERQRERVHVSVCLCTKYSLQLSDKYSFQNINTVEEGEREERGEEREGKRGFSLHCWC